jgi:transposase-like protein
MGLSRSPFDRDFKLNALRRLEMGVPIAELARGLEVNPNTLHRFPAKAKRAGRKVGLRSWSAK